MTYEEYVREVRKEFQIGAKPIAEVEKYFREKDTVDTLKESYKYFSEEDIPEAYPSAVANCLDLLW